MVSNIHPLLLSDTLILVLKRLAVKDLEKAQIICHKWNDISSILYAERLEKDFNISHETVISLSAPKIAYYRLMKIMERGKNKQLNEYHLHLSYISSGILDESLVHLLDNNKDWFAAHLANRDDFYLEKTFRYACIIGNKNLVAYLVEQKHCIPKPIHLQFAVASGQLELVKYLWDEKECIPNANHKDLINKAIISGNFPVLQYVQSKINWTPDETDIAASVLGGGLGVIQFLHQEYKLSGSNITFYHVAHSRNLRLLKYVVEQMSWEPRIEQLAFKGMGLHTRVLCMVQSAYQTGLMEIIQYVESKYKPKLGIESIFEAALESGNLESLHHFLRKYQIKLSNLNQNSSQSYLAWAIKSGNLGMVKYLVDESKFIPTRKDLITYAIKAQSITIVEFLVDNYNYKITVSDLKSAISTKSLIMFDKLLEKSKFKDEIRLAQLCTAGTSEIAIHHLLSVHHFKIDENDFNLFMSIIQNTKDVAFGIRLFDYLTTAYDYQPTPEIIAIVEKMKLNYTSKETKSMDEELKEESRCSIS